MQLPGSLRGTTLGDLLGRLHRERATGVLELIERGGPGAGRSHRIRLDQGLVSRVDSDLAGPRLGEILEEQGVLDAGAARRAAEAARRAGQPTGWQLLEREGLSPEHVAGALREQVRRRLEELFAIGDAEVRFHVPRPKRRDPAEPTPLTAPEFLHGRPRARGGASSQQRARVRRSEVEPVSASLRVLGLERGATLDDVKRAFRRLAAEHHPDRYRGSSDAERTRRLRRLTELTAAYHELLAQRFAQGA